MESLSKELKAQVIYAGLATIFDLCLRMFICLEILRGSIVCAMEIA
jgi:hypothetical protein